jgi:hypothetical protein
MSILREKIHDNRFLILIDNLLKAGYLEDWNFRPTLRRHSRSISNFPFTYISPGVALVVG